MSENISWQLKQFAMQLQISVCAQTTVKYLILSLKTLLYEILQSFTHGKTVY
jgi:hypothetical protein